MNVSAPEESGRGCIRLRYAESAICPIALLKSRTFTVKGWTSVVRRLSCDRSSNRYKVVQAPDRKRLSNLAALQAKTFLWTLQRRHAIFFGVSKGDGVERTEIGSIAGDAGSDGPQDAACTGAAARLRDCTPHRAVE